MEELLAKLAEAPETTKLVFMPISRAYVESECQVGEFQFFPPGAIDFLKFRPVDNLRYGDVANQPVARLKGQALREVVRP